MQYWSHDHGGLHPGGGGLHPGESASVVEPAKIKFKQTLVQQTV